MTDTAREAAIERVRAWVAENADKPDDYDTRDGDILLGDIRLLLTDPRQPSEAPVAWRVKDFADGWIVFDNKARAEEEAMATGALIQPLFASEPPVTADEGWRPSKEAVARIVAGQPYYERGKFCLQEYPPNPWDYEKADAILRLPPAPPTGGGGGL